MEKDAVPSYVCCQGRLGRARLCSRLCDASRNGSACVAHRLRTSASVKSLVKNPVTGCPFGSTCGAGKGLSQGGELGMGLIRAAVRCCSTSAMYCRGETRETWFTIRISLAKGEAHGQRANDDDDDDDPNPHHDP